jgi:hypothetical protein
MAIEGMQSILRRREEQFGRITQQPKQQPEDGEEALKLFFDYIKASNEQLAGICVSILDNQKVLELKINEIDKKLSDLHIKEE